MPDQAQIVKGEDRVLTLRVTKETREGEPFDLTGWTKILAEFKKSDRSLLQKTTEPVGGKAATAEHEGVTFTADEVGTEGNSISLVFDGSKTVQEVVDSWNTNNPDNTVSHDGDGTEVLSSATVELSGGEDPEIAVTVIGDPVLGKLQCALKDTDTDVMRIGNSQSMRLIIDKGDERRIAVFRNAINVVNPEF